MTTIHSPEPHIKYNGPTITVRFTSNAESLRAQASRDSLLRVCRFFNLLCEGAVNALGIFIVILITVAALCALVLGVFFGLAHLIHETVAPSEKVDDIAHVISLALYAIAGVSLIVYGVFDFIRSIWRKAAKG